MPDAGLLSGHGSRSTLEVRTGHGVRTGVEEDGEAGGLVHRYGIEPDGSQCDITYTCRLVRASALPGVLAIYGIPVLRSLASFEWARASSAGLRRLIAAAETSARA